MNRIEKDFEEIKKYFGGLIKLRLHIDKCLTSHFILENKIKDLLDNISSYTGNPELWQFYMETDLTNKSSKDGL